MTYATVQSGTLAVLKKLTEFDDSNCTANDYRSLALGKEYHIVLTKGTTGNRSMQDVTANGVYVKRSDRTVNIEIFVLHAVDLFTTRATLNTITQTVLDHLDKWPNLNQTAGVIETDADNTNRPEDYAAGMHQYLRQKIPFNVIELASVTVA